MTEPPDRPRWRRYAQDAGIAVGGCAVDLLGFSRVLAGPDAFPTWVAAYAAAGFVALLWRRRAPVAVYAVLWLHSTIASIAIPSYGPVIGLVVALYTVADLAPPRFGPAALAVALVPVGFQVAGEVASAPPEFAASALAASTTFLVAIVAGAWAGGRWARSRRAQLGLLEQQRLHTAREAVAQERTRIARDLHDVVSHSVGVMTLQAAGARRVLAAGKTDRAARALADIEGAGGQAMIELRRMLDVLRTAEPADGEEDRSDEQLAPAPGLREVDALVQGFLAAGVPARVVVSGSPGALDAGADMSAYRIIQESLTNVAKHAGPGVPTTVELRWTEHALEVVITSGEPRAPRPQNGSGPGYGLIGLRERAAAVGARFDAGPQADGGFRVAATLPVLDRQPAG
ncbi:sensor histidine kinase [Pseudonocardia sp. GCM10023141]|uniref:sensor histidine kinase n=1 Tax=Pseudonocardia sp. GCM10023141 TaxID=3252653 RepID=UPI003615A160